MIIFYVYLLLSIIIKCSTINNNEIILNNKSYDNELKSNLFPFVIIKIRKGFYELYNSVIFNNFNKIYKDFNRCFNIYILNNFDGYIDTILYNRFKPDCGFEHLYEIYKYGTSDNCLVIHPNKYYQESIHNHKEII